MRVRGTLAALALSLATSSGADDYPLQRAGIVVRDTDAGATAAQAAAEELGGGEVGRIDHGGGTTVFSRLLLPSDRLGEYAAALNRIDPHAAVSWKASTAKEKSASSRLRSLKEEAERFEPYVRAMPTAAAVLQAEIDQESGRKGERAGKPWTVLVLGISASEGPRLDLLRNASSIAVIPHDFEIAKRVATLPSPDPDGEPAVSADARKRGEAWSRWDKVFDCAHGGRTRFWVETGVPETLAQRLRRGGFGDAVPLSCPAAARPPVRRTLDMTVSLLLPSSRREELERLLRETAAITKLSTEESDVAGDGDERRERLDSLRQELEEQSEFLSGRPQLKRLLTETASQWDREASALAKAQQRHRVDLFLERR